MKKWELYTESKERFKKQQETHGFCNWQVFHDNFLLECWNMKNSKGQLEPTIIQFYQEGKGYEIYRVEN